jgi:hypothetical protein
MKLQSLVIALIGLSLAATSAISSDEDKLNDSLKKWQQSRKECKGNYAYTIRWSSFTGFGHETEVVVRDNKVAERRFRSFSGRPVPVAPGQPAPKPEGKSWLEKGKDLGTHKEGAPAKTLDELYAEAAAVLRRPLPEHERRYLRFDKQGILRSCFTVDTRIADDAPTKGVIISSVTLGAKADPMKEAAKKTFKSPSGKPYPAHWGEPPRIQTRDLRPLPGGYGRGSGTLARWIQMNLDRDAKNAPKDE